MYNSEVKTMAYFLKITNQPKGKYLQIYDSFYDKKRKVSRHTCFKKLGYEKKLITSTIKDPISYYKQEVIKLNNKQKKIKEENKQKKIGENIVKNIGYVLVKNLVNTLSLKEECEDMKYTNDFNYPIFKLIEALTYNRIIHPCSKLKTWEEIMPELYEKYDFSLSQIYDGIKYLGSRYGQFIEILNKCISDTFTRNTSTCFFDCTNYYFEIDFEKDDKQKGPCKENRPNPIIGQALLLDSDSIPLCMRMYPGNQSEKPYLPEIIKEMKDQNRIKGRTIQVADKGLNCGNNIYYAIKNKDGYIFSQSILRLEEAEKKWVLLQNGFTNKFNKDGTLEYKIKECIDYFPIRVTDGKGKVNIIKVKQKRIVSYNPSLAEKKKIEIFRLVEKANLLTLSKAKKEEYGECSKYIKFEDKKGEKIKPLINQEKIDNDLKYAGYNLLVTSELNMDKFEVYKVYHKLWKIEDTFRVLKSQLDARPVYLQNRESIYGHFLICYYAVTLLRLLEEKIFKNQYSIYELKKIIQDVNVVYCNDDLFKNITVKTSNIDEICSKYNLNINYLYLSEKQINKLFNLRYKINK